MSKDEIHSTRIDSGELWSDYIETPLSEQQRKDILKIFEGRYQTIVREEIEKAVFGITSLSTSQNQSTSESFTLEEFEQMLKKYVYPATFNDRVQKIVNKKREELQDVNLEEIDIDALRACAVLTEFHKFPFEHQDAPRLLEVADRTYKSWKVKILTRLCEANINTERGDYEKLLKRYLVITAMRTQAALEKKKHEHRAVETPGDGAPESSVHAEEQKKDPGI